MYSKILNSDGSTSDLTPSVGMAARSTLLALWRNIGIRRVASTMFKVLVWSGIAILVLLLISVAFNYDGFLSWVIAWRLGISHGV